MPGCYGLELIQHAKESLPQLEIVIISGYAHFEYAQSAIKHGVGDYLLKPIQKGELMATLQKLGDRCRARLAQGQPGGKSVQPGGSVSPAKPAGAGSGAAAAESPLRQAFGAGVPHLCAARPAAGHAAEAGL